jgi:Na+-transporting NADH:ubiquinone oxidoreductase subunit NqrF
MIDLTQQQKFMNGKHQMNSKYKPLFDQTRKHQSQPKLSLWYMSKSQRGSPLSSSMKYSLMSWLLIAIAYR